MACHDAGKQWREEILSGVDSIPKIGNAGTMVVNGENAEPILTGNTAKDVVLAAAELGEGRIAVFAHDGYTNAWFIKNEIPENAKKFCGNLLAWLSKGKYDKEWTVSPINKRSLKEANPIDTILVWHGPKPKDAELVDDLIKFVKEGGSVMIGVTPWGAKQVHGCELDEISCYRFLREVQIFLTDGYSVIDGGEIKVSDNKAECAHVGQLLHKCKMGQMKICDLGAEVTAELGAIPDEDCCAILHEHITGVDVSNMCSHPQPKKPLKSDEERATALFVNLVLKKSKQKAMGLSEFPGDFDEPPPTSCVEHKIDSTCNEAHPVGAYLTSGGTAVIEVVDGKPNGWKVQIGCHTDNLRASDKFKRWPDIAVRQKLETKGETKIHSPFGGSIYLFSPNGTSSLSVRIKDVVASPLFHIDDKPEEWNENRMKPGLWADLVGKHMMISVPSKSIRDIDYPLEVMEFWDAVVMAHHDLKGVDLTNKRREWFVPDVQPSAGYMHSGYPVVTHMDAADPKQKMFLIKKPKYSVDGHWGYFHELGHNMQDGAWTFQGTGEVTCNIFSLHGMEKMFNVKPWEHPWVENQKPAMKKYLENGAKFEEWLKHPGVALGIYAQLARDFGFDAYKKVFRKYETEKPKLRSNQEKIDHWVKTFSKVVDANLVPAFKLWGIPVSEAAIKELAGLKEYLPQDEVTEVIMAS